MTWNYRIIDHGDWLGLHECFYDENDKPNGWTADPITFSCDKDEGTDGIIKSLELALADAKKHPVLTPPGNDHA